MANGKTFADMKKPVRQPTPEQIAAFEETGRADRRLTPELLATETQKAVEAETREHTNTETHISVEPDLQEHADPQTQKPVEADSRITVDVRTHKVVDTETQKPVPIVRLTIDLDEALHTRFKTACVMTKRKMVEEVRTFIEQRTMDLEKESGRAR